MKRNPRIKIALRKKDRLLEIIGWVRAPIKLSHIPGGTFKIRTMKDVIRNLYGDRGVIIDATSRQKTLTEGTLTAIISE